MKRTKISLFTIMLILTLFTASGLHSTWVFNGTPPPTNDDDNNNTIINAASSFLHSYSNVLLLLQESELNTAIGFNFSRTKPAVETALNNLKYSRKEYARVLEIMKTACIDSSAVERLKDFDYGRFTSARRLNPCIMNIVSGFLSKGDLVGLFEKVVKDLDDTIINLSTIRNCLQQDIIPDLEDLRRLYQQYSDFMTFGYYCSLVFSEIKK
jgi:hypothetical protein